MADTFVCAACGGEFEKQRTDEEAMEDAKSRGHVPPDEPLAVVCEDCWAIIMANMSGQIGTA